MSDIICHTRHFYILKTPAISDILCKIFNESFIDGVIPNHMKMAMVTQITKEALNYVFVTTDQSL